MKYVIIAFLTCLLMTACTETKKEKAQIQKMGISGAPGDLMVIMDKKYWDSIPGDSVRTFFLREMLGLPQYEPMFKVVNLPLYMFEKNIKTYRNILYVNISSELDTAFEYKQDPWARPQNFFQIDAPNTSAFVKIFVEYRDSIENTYLEGERVRYLYAFAKQKNDLAVRTMAERYKISWIIPGDYVWNKDENGFIWISSETRVDSRGLLFFTQPYKNEKQLTRKEVVKFVNLQLKDHIPGPLSNTYMALDEKIPMIAKNIQWAGTSAMQYRGMWTVVNDFMAGPFVMNVTIDPLHNRIVYAIGYIYAPSDKKRNMLRQVEASISTIKFLQ